MADISILVDYSDVQKANREIEGLGTSAEKSARVFEKAFSRAETATKRNLTRLKQESSTRQALEKQKQAQLAQEAALLDRLSQKYKPLYAASKLYSKTLDEINQAHKIGAISVQQHEAALERLNAEYTAFGNGTASSLNMFNQGLSRSNRRISQTSVLTQQAGYQIGDFIVQVQSGTNAFVAFGQQATQVAGTLTLLGGKWVLIGSTLGVAIPLFTAAAAAIMRSRKSAEEADKRFSSLAESIGNLEKYSTSLVGVNEKVKESFQSLISVVQEVEGIALQKSLEEVLKPFEAEIRRYEKRFANFKRFGGFGFEEPEFKSSLGFEDAERAVQAYTLLRNIQGETKEEIAESLRMTELWLRGSGLLTDEVKALLTEYVKALDLQDTIVESLGEATERSEILKMTLEAISINGLLGQMDTLNSQLGSAIFGAGTLTARLGKAFNAVVDIAENVKLQKESDAARASGFRFGTAPVGKTEAFFGLGGLPLNGTSTDEIRGAMGVAASRGGSRGGSSGSGRGGGTPKETPEDYLKTLTEEVSRKEQLIGLFGEERAIRERVLDLQKRAQDKDLEISESKLKSITLQEQAVEKSLQRQEELYNKFSNQIENSLMNLVDGSETVGEAFKNLIRTMILEMYREKFVKPFAQSAGGFLSGLFPFANGGVFQGGAQVTAFANGGVVSGPTTFPMQGGMGLMGEAGPEAIMPLKRGANGKLGVETSGNQQPINMTFNISTPDVRGFERSKTQIAASMQRTLQQGQRNQ